MILIAVIVVTTVMTDGRMTAGVMIANVGETTTVGVTMTDETETVAVTMTGGETVIETGVAAAVATAEVVIVNGTVAVEARAEMATDVAETEVAIVPRLQLSRSF